MGRDFRWNILGSSKVTGDSPVSGVAGAGYFMNTTSGAITLTLPGSPTIGDEISFVDMQVLSILII